MILSRYAYTKIAPNNYAHWKNLGYEIRPTGGYSARNTGQRIKISVEHLLGGSNVNVSCRCDQCGKKYIQRFCRNTNVCYLCRKTTQMVGNTHGSANKGKKLPHMSGENHPRWNPNKKELITFTNRVHWLTRRTYEDNIDLLNPDRYPRTLCGVEGGYQLDHKTSIKKAFELGWTPEQCADVSNLQLLPWKDNREKWH